MMKKAFTLVELLVVIGMIAVLMGSAAAGFSKARERAKVAKATADVKEITNAILAYENYAPDRSLGSIQGRAQGDATQGSLGFLVGGENDDEGNPIPILYNAQFDNRGYILDPWGTPYKVVIESPAEDDDSEEGDDLGIRQMSMGIYLPNMNGKERK